MNPILPSLTEQGPIVAYFWLAQGKYFDAQPSSAAALPASRAAVKIDARPGPLQRLFDTIDDWFHRQTMKERDAYLGQAQDIFDLESRVRHLERYTYY